MAVKEKELTRRSFIKGAGAAFAATALSAGFGGFLSGCGQAEGKDANGDAKVEWPLPYHELDPAKAEEIAYNSYKAGNG
jgi:hypothetical protein